MIYKIKIRYKEDGEECFVITGDSYKSFEDHFVNIVDSFTKKWHYKDSSKHSECLGRTLRVDFLELWRSKNRFVSFGGLKMAFEENYDKEVSKHNKSNNYLACKYLKDINWVKDDELLSDLLELNRVIEHA